MKIIFKTSQKSIDQRRASVSKYAGGIEIYRSADSRDSRQSDLYTRSSERREPDKSLSRYFRQWLMRSDLRAPLAQDRPKGTQGFTVHIKSIQLFELCPRQCSGPGCTEEIAL